jgi:1-acyl-sn-glycerol-3-phosphate acyltransferase
MAMMRSSRAGRRLGRLGRLAGVLGQSGALERRIRRDHPDDEHARPQWMQEMARRFLAVLGGRVELSGVPPAGGLLVANHLGYVDVLAIGSVAPAIFLAKHEVATWPVFGSLVRRAGTLFVRRDRRTDVARCVRQMTRLLQAGHRVVVFPEGTSSAGTDVLPFHSALLEAVGQSDCVVTPVTVRYEGADQGAPIAYWGSDSFGPHLWRLLGGRGFVARLHFGDPVPAADRKLLAATLHARIRQQLGHGPAGP